MRAALLRIFAALAIVAVLVVSGVFVLTNTNLGREQVRKRVVAALQDNSRGIITTGRLTGNLLEGFVLHDLVITDSAGEPLANIAEVHARYQIRALTSERVDFDDVLLVRPILVLDRKPGGIWNFDRIFPRDTITPEGERVPGWGTWIRFTNLTVRDGDLTVRTPWEPEGLLAADARNDVIRQELGPEGRLVLEEVEGGYQKISKFHNIDAEIPLLRFQDPAYPTRRVDIAALNMIAEPFRPPVAEVRSMVGDFEFTEDSVWWQDVKVALPGSQLTGSGRYTIETGDLTLRARANPVALADLRWVYPRTPERGSGTLDFALDWAGDTSTYIAQNADVRIADAHLRGDLGITVAESFTLHDTDLRFSNLDTRLIESMFPAIEPPRSGILSGRAKLDGNQQNMVVDGDITFNDRRAGLNRVLAVGKVGFGNGDFRAENLRLTMRPVQVDISRDFASDLPIRGTLTGTATLNGSTASRMTARADITHVDRGATSRITGTGALRKPSSGTFASSWFDVDARVHPLSLETVGRFFPSAGLRGTANGPLRLTGTTRQLAVRSNLAFPDGGTFGLTGTLDLASAEKGYDLDMVAELFNANTILAKAPVTSVTGTASAEGRGFDPATMRANIVADLQSSTYDTLSVTAAKLRVATADGMARIDTLSVEIPEGVANASGTFGLKRGTTGELRYNVDIDSLSRLSGFLPPAREGVVEPRPGILASRIERARADSAREAKATEVERAALGQPPVTRAPVDTPQAIPRTILAGALRAEGVATGNIHDFGLEGTASGENILVQGNSIQRVRADYSWTNALTPQSQVEIDASAGVVSAAGFDLDSIQAKISYRQPNGTADILVVQNQEDEYSLDADYVLNNIRNELRLNRMQLRFDTTVWASTRPSVVHWGTEGWDIGELELRNTANGRIFVDGLIPREGRANLEIAVDNFAVEDLISLAQSDIDAKGLVSLDLRAEGTAVDPTFSGSFGTQDFLYNGTLIPEVHGTLSYAAQTLTGRADAMRAGGKSFLFAEGTIPINLAFSGVTGSRLPRDRQIDLAIRTDSLPLDLVPQVNAYVSNLQGRAIADFKVAGSLNRPEITGQFTLDSARARLPILGIDLTGIDGSIRMLGDTVVIDSLVAYSGGRIEITGGLGIGSLREPSFDVRMFSNNATLIDSKDGKIRANLDLTARGPFTNTYISGNVRVLNGVIYVPKSEGKTLVGVGDPALFSVLDTAVLENRELFPAQSPLLANLRMDVNLRVDRDFFVRSADFNVEFYSERDLVVHVDRARERIVLDGVLLTERGSYSFLSKRFDIKRGSATFTNSGELNPILQGTGSYEVKLPAREAINIEIIVGGTLRNPQLSLQSDAQPPITQSDLLSYLAFGQSSSSLLQLEGSGLSSGAGIVGAGAELASKQLAAVALGVFADQLAGEAARSLGADVFTISPADIQADVGSFLRATEIEFGKYIRGHSFVAVNLRPDPAALQRPGFLLQHRFGGLKGYSYELTFQPRYLLREPTLELRNPNTTSVFSLFFIRNWRY
ncbi:MAG: translocation/assembly module TamB domain-containing protein [Gemmatimonadaceae bacterium]